MTLESRHNRSASCPFKRLFSYRHFLACFRRKRARNRNTRYLQISRWQFGADSSIILEFIACRVKARGDDPFAL